MNEYHQTAQPLGGCRRWGKRYRMTWDFIVNIVDEVYAIIDSAWIAAGGLTPAGMTLAELGEQMKFLRKQNQPPNVDELFEEKI